MMHFLTKPIGRFPLGIWIALLILLVTGCAFTLYGQGLSLVSWDTAFSLGLQENSYYSTNLAERTRGGMSWGEAAADVPVQGTLIVMTLFGIFRRRLFGFIAGVSQAILWIYVTWMVVLQRVGFYLWGVVPDLSEFQRLLPIMFLVVGIPGMVMLICLIANRRFFRVDT